MQQTTPQDVDLVFTGVSCQRSNKPQPAETERTFLHYVAGQWPETRTTNAGLLRDNKRQQLKQLQEQQENNSENEHLKQYALFIRSRTIPWHSSLIIHNKRPHQKGTETAFADTCMRDNAIKCSWRSYE